MRRGLKAWDVSQMVGSASPTDGPRPLGGEHWELSEERGSNKQVKCKAPSEFEMGRVVPTWKLQTGKWGLRMEGAELKPLNGAGREKEPF